MKQRNERMKEMKERQKWKKEINKRKTEMKEAKKETNKEIKERMKERKQNLIRNTVGAEWPESAVYTKRGNLDFFFFGVLEYVFIFF